METITKSSLTISIRSSHNHHSWFYRLITCDSRRTRRRCHNGDKPTNLCMQLNSLTSVLTDRKRTTTHWQNLAFHHLHNGLQVITWTVFYVHRPSWKRTYYVNVATSTPGEKFWARLTNRIQGPTSWFRNWSQESKKRLHIWKNQHGAWWN
jgi:hypothetical protein